MKLKIIVLSILCFVTTTSLAQEISINELISQAENENIEAQLHLATRYISGEYEDIDLNKGIFWLQKAAENGNVEAGYQLGLSYILGNGIEPDVERGFSYILDAAETGYVPAQGCLGHMFYKGTALEYYIEQMQYVIYQPLFYHYILQQDAISIEYSDIPVEQNDDKALYWLDLAAKNGDTYAMLTLSDIYKEGHCGLEPDSIKWIEVLRGSAESDNALAQMRLAFCYRDGTGVDSDYKKYMEWLIKSAQGGNLFALGMCGDELLSMELYDDAVYNYMRIVSYPSHPEFELEQHASNQVSSILQKGLCSENMIDYALDCFEEELNMGDIGVSTILADLYMFEGSYLYDPAKGIKYLKISAEAGNAAAQYHLGYSYYLGIGGLNIDIDKTAELFSASALRGNTKAMQGGFIICDYADKCTDKNKKKQLAAIGVKLLEMGIEQGDSECAWKLGLVYSNGAGVARSSKLAYQYIGMAARMGNTKAEEYYNRYYL